MSRVLAAIAAVLCFAAAQTPSMTAHFINIGQGESVLLEFPCGAMLIDAGAQDGAARTRLIAYLNKFFTRRTDLHKTINTILVTRTIFIRKLESVVRSVGIVTRTETGPS